MISVKVILIVVAVACAVGVGVYIVPSIGGKDAALVAAEKKWRDRKCAGPFDAKANPDTCFQRQEVENSPTKGF